MPGVAGTYQAVVRIKKIVSRTAAESKGDAIRTVLLTLAAEEGRTSFEEWVKGGMEIELVKS